MCACVGERESGRALCVPVSVCVCVCVYACAESERGSSPALSGSSLMLPRVHLLQHLSNTAILLCCVLRQSSTSYYQALSYY